MRQSRLSFSFGGLFALALLLAVSWLHRPATAQQLPASELPAGSVAETLGREVRAVVSHCEAAVCRIEAVDELGFVRGTGFFVDADGTLLTSFSVGGETQDLVVGIGEERFPAVRLAADAQSGLAVLKIEAQGTPRPFLKMGRSMELVPGSPVLALGYPLELPLSPSFGLLASFDLGFKERFFVTRHLRANLAVQRGQGGSPILNMRGEAVGVLISTVEGNSGVFALPIEAARKVLHDLREHGGVRQGWLGADISVAQPVQGSTARVPAVRPDGPGEKGGLQAGDVLLQIGAWKIATPEDVLSARFYITAGEALPVRVARDGQIVDLTIVPEDPPAGSLPTIERKSSPTPAARPLSLGP